MQQHSNHLGQPIGFPVTDWKPANVPSRETMTGRFCRVEPLNPQLHAQSLHAANAQDGEGRMWTYMPYGPFGSLSEYRAWMGDVCRRNDPLFFAILDLRTNRATGVASYLRIEPKSGCIEVGHISFSPRLQRTPAATEAMFLMMERVFALGYRRYEWKCDALNAASRAAALRLGFKFEGVFRQATVVKGRNRDTAWFSIIDSEWPARREAFQRWLAPGNFDEQGRQRSSLSALNSTLR